MNFAVVILVIFFFDVLGYGFWPENYQENSLTRAISTGLNLLTLFSSLILIMLFRGGVSALYNRAFCLIFFAIIILNVGQLFVVGFSYNTTVISIRVLLILVTTILVPVCCIRRAVHFHAWFFLLSTLFVISFVPSLAFEKVVNIGSLKGLVEYKTQFAIASSFFFFYIFFSGGGIYTKVFLMVSFFLFCLFSNSLSVTVILIFFIFYSVYKRLLGTEGFLYIFCCFLFLAMPGVLSVYSYLNYYDVLSLLGKTDSVNTRFYIWGYSLSNISSYVYGNGLSDFFNQSAHLENIAEATYFTHISTLHNAYMEWIIGGGIVGGALWVYALSLFFKKGNRVNKLGFERVFGVTLIAISFIVSSVAFSSLTWLVIGLAIKNTYETDKV
jgi:hypothetical protein